MITIVGAGLVGSLWATILRKQGYEVTLFERRSDPRKINLNAGRSINLIITSRGLYALDQAGLLNQALKLSVPVYGRMIHSKAGDLTYQPYGQENECNLSISRIDLNKFLIDEAEKAGTKIHFEHEVIDLLPQQKEVLFKTPVGEKKYNYDILFGADGSGSKVRKKLAELYADECSEQTQWLEADYKELTLPLGPDGKPQLKTDALHIWPRGSHMMMALANLDGSFTVTAYLPKTSSNWSFDKINSEQDIEKLFKNEFSDAITLMPDYQDEFINNPQGALGTVRCSQWVFENSIALMGDAAHGVVPFFGQGMNSGFEDCSCLLTLLKDKPNDWAYILNSYNRIQKPNTDAIADMAIENWTEMRDKVGDARFLLRKKIESTLEQKYNGVFKARYGLITYTLVPYAVAKEAGLIQNKIIDALLTDNINSIEQISWEKADQLIHELWKPFLIHKNIKLKTYLPNIKK